MPLRHYLCHTCDCSTTRTKVTVNGGGPQNLHCYGKKLVAFLSANSGSKLRTAGSFCPQYSNTGKNRQITPTFNARGIFNYYRGTVRKMRIYNVKKILKSKKVEFLRVQGIRLSLLSLFK